MLLQVAARVGSYAGVSPLRPYSFVEYPSRPPYEDQLGKLQPFRLCTEGFYLHTMNLNHTIVYVTQTTNRPPPLFPDGAGIKKPMVFCADGAWHVENYRANYENRVQELYEKEHPPPYIAETRHQARLPQDKPKWWGDKTKEEMEKNNPMLNKDAHYALQIKYVDDSDSEVESDGE